MGVREREGGRRGACNSILPSKKREEEEGKGEAKTGRAGEEKRKGTPPFAGREGEGAKGPRWSALHGREE